MHRAGHMLRKGLGGPSALTFRLYSSRKWRWKLTCKLPGWVVKARAPTHTLAPEAAVSTPLTCACDKCHKVFKALSLAEFPFCQGSTVAIIVYPYGEMQSVRQGGPEIHRVPLLNQFGWMQHNSFPRIYTATCGNAWAPPQTQGKWFWWAISEKCADFLGLEHKLIHPRSPKTNITKDCKEM